MGCQNSKADEPTKSAGFKYPKCESTIPMEHEVGSILPLTNGKVLLGAKGELNILDLNSKEITLFNKEHKGRINCILRLNNGLIVTMGQDKLIKVFEFPKPEPLATMEGHTSMIWNASVLSNGNLVTASDDRSIRIWDMKEYKQLKVLVEKCETECSAVLGLSTGNILASYNNKLVLYDGNEYSILGELDIKLNAWYMIEFKDGRIGAGLSDGDIALLQISVNNEITLVGRFSDGHKKSVNHIQQINDKYFFSSADEEKMIIWNLTDPSSKYFLEGHSATVTCSIFTDQNKFISWAKDKTLKIWC